MKIYTDSSDIEKNKDTIITVGTFDGLHKGHLNILNTVIRKAKKINGRSFVITFEPHPRSVVSKDFDLKILTTLNEKIPLLEEIGISNLMIINFSKEFSQLTSEEFVERFICDKIGTRHLVIGHDHKFGKNRDGDEKKLIELGSKFNFGVTAVPAVKVGNELISSTVIRNTLLNGEIEKANLYLGRNYTLSGTVIKGAKRGGLLGFHTANIQAENEYKLTPKKGVYIVKVELGSGNYFGLMNIGHRPTFENVDSIVVEVHLIDFDGNLYGSKIKVEFLKRIRDEKKFDSKELLIEQIKKDKKEALEIISALIN